MEPQARQQWVVGYDESSDSLHALRWALAQSDRCDASLRVVRAWSVPLGAEFDAQQLMELGKRSAQTSLDSLRATLDTDHPDIHYTAEYGGSTAVLLEQLADSQLLVVGTRGQGGFKRLLLGSTSHACAAHSSGPIAVIPSSTPLTGAMNRIVVGMDGSANAKAALAWALDFAPAGVTINVVGTFAPSSHGLQSAVDSTIVLQDRKQDVDSAIDEVLSGTNYTQRVERAFVLGAADETLLATNADLIVVGARGHGAIGSAILGSVTSRLLHRAAAPLVVVPQPAA